MGAAAMAFTVWTRHLRHNPRNPRWMGRDRFLLSGGHGSMVEFLLSLAGNTVYDYNYYGVLYPKIVINLG